MKNSMEFAPKARAGFSMVEVLVAIALLSVVLTSLASLTFVVARRTVLVTGSAYRQGAVAEAVNRLMVVPFDSLASRAGCVTVTSPPLPHVRCVTFTTPSNNVRTVRVVITPTNPTLPADTVTFTRAKTNGRNPLSTP